MFRREILGCPILSLRLQLRDGLRREEGFLLCFFGTTTQPLALPLERDRAGSKR